MGSIWRKLDDNEKNMLLFAVGALVAFAALWILARNKSAVVAPAAASTAAAPSPSVGAPTPTEDYHVTLNSYNSLPAQAATAGPALVPHAPPSWHNPDRGFIRHPAPAGPAGGVSTGYPIQDNTSIAPAYW